MITSAFDHIYGSRQTTKQASKGRRLPGLAPSRAYSLPDRVITAFGLDGLTLPSTLLLTLLCTPSSFLATLDLPDILLPRSVEN